MTSCREEPVARNRTPACHRAKHITGFAAPLPDLTTRLRIPAALRTGASASTCTFCRAERPVILRDGCVLPAQSHPSLKITTL